MALRNLSPAVVSLILAKKVKPAIFLYGDFPSGARRIWTGRGNYTDDEANVWVGTGALVAIKSIQETVDTAAQGLEVTLDGLDDSLILELTGQPYSGRSAEVLLGFWDFNVLPLRVTMLEEPLWRGFLDTDDVTMGEKENSLTIFCEHRLVDLLRKREVRYTDQDQQYLNPGEGDTGLSKIEVIQDRSVTWGKTEK